MSYTPQDLINAAKCMKCIPKGMQREVQIIEACVAAGGVLQESFLIQSDDGDYIVLDDGGRIILS